MLSLVAVTTVVVLAASFSRFASAVANRQAQAVSKKRAFYLAEAGLAEAFMGFTLGKSGNVGSELEPAILADGVFWAEATEIDTGIVRLRAVGMAGTGRAELSIVTEFGKKSVAQLGMFSNGKLLLQAGSLIDAYDSSKGTYESQKDHSGVVLGSNAAIEINGTLLAPTTVDGDVTPGPAQAVTTVGAVTVTGSSVEAIGLTELPAVVMPELSLEPTRAHDSPYPLVIPAGTVGYEGLEVASGGEVIIQGPAVVVLGSLALAPEAQLTFDTAQGSVKLYVSDAIQLQAGSLLVTSSQLPGEVLIQVPGETLQPLVLESSGAFHGVIYAPEAEVNLGSSFELFGALIADSVTFDGASKLHFDLNLARTAVDTALPKVLTWRLIELGNAATDISRDPFEILGVDRTTLLEPTESHADQVLVMDYYDIFDVYRRYTGSESNFDWSTVKQVISATRDGTEVYYPTSGNLTKVGSPKSPMMAPIVN